MGRRHKLYSLVNLEIEITEKVQMKQEAPRTLFVVYHHQTTLQGP